MMIKISSASECLKRPHVRGLMSLARRGRCQAQSFLRKQESEAFGSAPLEGDSHLRGNAPCFERDHIPNDTRPLGRGTRCNEAVIRFGKEKPLFSRN